MICVKVLLVLALGTGQIPTGDAISVAGTLERQFKRQGICVDVYRIVKVRDHTKDDNTVASMDRRFARWQTWRLNKNFPQSITHFMLPPMYHQGVFGWMAGMATRVCRPSYGMSWSTGRDYGTAEFSRKMRALLIFLHEIGHLLGAPHRDDCKIMHPAASAMYKGGKLEFHPLSVWNMNKCLKIYGYEK